MFEDCEYSERAEAIHVSALNQYAYCPRRCGLIYVEQVWEENIYTMRGNDVHEKVDIECAHIIEGIRYERALPIWSKRLNLVGKADLIEFHGDMPYPVEYKSGKFKRYKQDHLQLCAQAICLEEMLNVSVEKGAIYWHASRERKEIIFTPAMRERVETVAASVHDIIAKQYVPPPVNDKRCKDCSLNESCMPKVVDNKSQAGIFIKKLFIADPANEEWT